MVNRKTGDNKRPAMARKSNIGSVVVQTQPLVEEICPAPEPVDVFRRLSRFSHCLFLDSAASGTELGRYSFVTADPFEWLRASDCHNDGLSILGQKLARRRLQTLPGLPPFQGGAAGLFSFDLGRSWERIPVPLHDEFQIPAMCVGFYDVVVAWDHHTEQAWIISSGLPEMDKQHRQRRAASRLSKIRNVLQTGSNHQQADGPPISGSGLLSPQELSTQFPAPRDKRVTSNFSREGYLAVVRRAIEYIGAGDIFQVNLAQRLLHPARADSLDLYLRLRQCNPAPFASYFDVGSFQIISASPERFLCLEGGRVEARPIKGTRPRNPLAEADLFSGDELRQSEKDRAENVMIVDLLRNDLSRVCLPASVCVTQLCEIERFAYVQHLVSAIEGELSPEKEPVDLVRAAFPGGSITGAPKVRAMQIISELEPNTRGAYCGSLGYIGFDGTLDLNILIRTITAGRGWWQMPVGGGIVAQSDPEREYEETWHKAEGMLRAL